ncbi:hypothetical protein V6N13_146373 [Hibiscus sabdariffa]
MVDDKTESSREKGVTVPPRPPREMLLKRWPSVMAVNAVPIDGERAPDNERKGAYCAPMPLWREKGEEGRGSEFGPSYVMFWAMQVSLVFLLN